MEKRTLLALGLVAVVIIATPRLFPGPPVAEKGPPGDTTLAPRTETPSATPAPVVAAQTPRDSLGPKASVAERPLSDSTTTIRQTSPSPSSASSVVEGKAAAFHFATPGATLQGVTLTAYNDLHRKDGSPVQLVAPGGSLVSYRLVSGRDTVSLASTPFAASREQVRPGVERVTYRGVVRGADLSIRYDVVPDSFIVRVNASVTGSDSLGAPQYMLVDLPRTYRSFEADTLDDQRHFAFAYQAQNASAEGMPFGKLDPGERAVARGPFNWVTSKTKYFILGLLPAVNDPAFVEMNMVGGPRTSKTATIAEGTIVAKLNNGQLAFDIYAGPQQWRRLQAMGRNFEDSNPYGGFLQPVVQPFARIVMQILLWMRDNLKLNYGWVLIIFGIAVRLVLWPLNQKGMRASMKMQRIQPELNDIQKRYKSDPQKMQAEMMRVYKEHDMSPFSTFAGCLPLFLPLPILFALFFVFQSTIEFRGVPFLWFADISQKDPYYIIALLMGASMFLLSWIGMRNMPPNPQTKAMTYVFPVMMTVLFANFPAGMNMYYTIQNLAALPQQWLISNERARQNAAKGKT